MKLPILNNHKVKGIFDQDFKFLPEHYAWITHLIFGLISIYYPIVTPIFIGYQVVQMITKRKMWDDFIDIVEFYVGRVLSEYIIY